MPPLRPNVVVGVCFLLFGAVGVRYPRRLADLSEKLDAIGSTRETWLVEAAEWKVTLTKFFGAVSLVVGAMFVLSGLLATL